MRPAEEYRPATEQEWAEFEEHFDKRKVELGTCGRLWVPESGSWVLSWEFVEEAIAPR
jgi:hypothetical protein